MKLEMPSDGYLFVGQYTIEFDGEDVTRVFRIIDEMTPIKGKDPQLLSIRIRCFFSLLDSIFDNKRVLGVADYYDQVPYRAIAQLWVVQAVQFRFKRLNAIICKLNDAMIRGKSKKNKQSNLSKLATEVSELAVKDRTGAVDLVVQAYDDHQKMKELSKKLQKFSKELQADDKSVDLTEIKALMEFVLRDVTDDVGVDFMKHWKERKIQLVSKLTDRSLSISERLRVIKRDESATPSHQEKNFTSTKKTNSASEMRLDNIDPESTESQMVLNQVLSTRPPANQNSQLNGRIPWSITPSSPLKNSFNVTHRNNGRRKYEKIESGSSGHDGAKLSPKAYSQYTQEQAWGFERTK